VQLVDGEPPRHYPYVTRMLLELERDGLLPHVKTVEVEPQYGYAARITYLDGRVRLTHGGDVGLNTGAACDVLRDKEHTKFLLEARGFVCPRGRAFLLPWWATAIGPNLASKGFSAMQAVGEATSYVRAELGYPIYVKPVRGSQGRRVHRCEEDADLDAAAVEFEAARVRVIVVEEAVAMPDYRLVVLNDRLISAYRRVPLAVIGDGHTSIRELLDKVAATFAAEGRDTRIQQDDERIARRLRRVAMEWSSVPASGERVQLLDISNLSAGGTAEDVTSSVSPHWRTLAADVARSFGVAFCGIDLACVDITAPSEYSIIEVNAAPGLDHYASVGPAQEDVVRRLYAEVLDLSPMAAAGA
jgi:D-alanine-D-alanine ligase-like ATP-grasp enzyme